MAAHAKLWIIVMTLHQALVSGFISPFNAANCVYTEVYRAPCCTIKTLSTVLASSRKSQSSLIKIPASTRTSSTKLRMSQDTGAKSESVEDMMKRLASITSADERMQALRSCYQRIDNDAIAILSKKVSEQETSWLALLKDLQTLTDERLIAGKQLLVELLNSGELTTLDRKIAECVKSGRIDPGFMTVLDTNLNDAQAAGESGQTRLQVLAHVFTRVQEELEKLADPAVGLLHKLLRMSAEASIRANLLEHNLRPKPEEDHTYIYVDGQLTLDKGARVSPDALARTIVAYMDRARGAAAAADEDMLGRLFEDLRVIGKEARAVVERYYDKDELEEFTAVLTPAFQPIMETLRKYRT